MTTSKCMGCLIKDEISQVSRNKLAISRQTFNSFKFNYVAHQRHKIMMRLAFSIDLTKAATTKSFQWDCLIYPNFIKRAVSLAALETKPLWGQETVCLFLHVCGCARMRENLSTLTLTLSAECVIDRNRLSESNHNTDGSITHTHVHTHTKQTEKEI